MNNAKRPPVWKLVLEAVQALGGRTTNVAVRDWILARYLAQRISKRIRYALADVENVQLKEYEISLRISDVERLG